MKLARALSFLLFMSALMACAPPRPTAETPPRIFLSERACQRPYLTSLLSTDGLSEVDRPILAGGVVKSGGFLIAIWLYCDQSLSSDEHGAAFSEVRNLGFRYEWEYLGPPIKEESTTSITVNGEMMRHTGGGPGVGTGDTETSTGEIGTPSEALALAIAASQPAEFRVTVSAPDPLASATLTVTFQFDSDGYRVASAEIRAQGPDTK